MNTDTRKNKGRKALPILGKLLLTLAALAVIFFGGTLLSLLLMSEDIALHITYIVAYLLPLLLLPVIWLKNRKKFMKIWLVAALLCLVVLGANFGILKHREAIEIDTSAHCDVQYYLPFREESEAVNIESKTLKFTEDFPLMDGSEAVIPMYCAFVNSVYPESETPYGDYMECNDQDSYEYLANKQTDIFFDIFTSEEQKAYAESFDAAFEYTELGSDAFVFFVHKDNPIESLTTQQVKDIYSGKITNWAELGGKNKAIKAYQTEADSISQNMMIAFMGETALMEPVKEMAYDYLYAWEETTAVYKNKAASIGFCFRHCVENNPEIKMLSIDGFAPTKENIQTGSYPYVYPILAVTNEENGSENLSKLMDWILSDEGQHIIEESGYVGLADGISG